MEKNEDRDTSYRDMQFKQLIQAEEFNFQESVLFDKSMLALAGGVFGLSLTFIKQIPHTNYIGFLRYSWILYIFSILATLISMLVSQSAVAEKVKFLTSEIANPKANNSYSNHLASWVLCLNICSIICFIAGSILISVFVVLNLH